MAGEIAFAAPRVEEMTKTVIGLGTGVVTGLVEGIAINMAPALGAMQPVITWGCLLGVPVIGVAGALFSRGMVGDMFQGIAGAGAGILGYSLPALLKPYLPAGAGQGARPLSEQSGVKQLPPGPAYAPQRAQAQARVGLEF